jgi:hypothetical protein
MAWSPSESNNTSPETSGVDRNLAVTMIMRNPDANTENVGDRATQICEAVAALPATAAEEEEPSIAEYMEALLRRARGSEGANPERTIPLASLRVEPRAAAPSVKDPAPVVQVVAPQTPAPPPPPECRNAFSEMRQLANATTRTTFHSQLGLRLIREMRWNGLVAIGSIVTSVVLLGLSPSAQSPIFYTAVAATVVAAAWVLKFFAAGRLLQCVIAEAAAEASTPAE